MIRDFLFPCARMIDLLVVLALPGTLLVFWLLAPPAFVLALVAMALVLVTLALAVPWDSLAADPFHKPFRSLLRRRR